MKKLLTIWTLCLLSSIEATAQVGSITGRVLDEKKKPISGAFIEVSVEGIKKLKTTTEEGDYILKPLQPSRYDVIVRHTGYKTIKTTGVIVSTDKNTILNYVMSPLLDTSITQITRKYVCQFNEPERKTITAEDIEKMPTRSMYNTIQPAISNDKNSSQGYTPNKKKKKRKWLIF